MDNISEITSIVKEAVISLCDRRCSSDFFRDDYDVKDRAFVSTCEGIECILLPCLIFSKIKLSSLIKRFPKLLKCIQSDVEYIISRSNIQNEIKKGGFVFPGDPYLGTGRRVTVDNQLQNLDSLAMALSSMLHFKKVFENENISTTGFQIIKIKELIKDGLNQITNSHIQNQGWPWNYNGKKSNVYFTYSVLETLSDIFEYDKGRELFNDYDSLIKTTNETRKWIEETYIKEMAAGNEIGSSIKKTYYYIEALISLTILGTDKYKEIADFLKHLLPFSNKIANVTLFAQYEINGQRTVLTDYSIIPLLLRGVSAAFLEFGTNKDFNEELSFIKHKEVIDRRLKDLSQKRTKEGLWAYDSDRFELYYTERAIEALVMYYLYKKQIKKPRLPIKSFKEMSKNFKLIEKEVLK